MQNESQIRAARALLDWTQEDLEAAADVSRLTIRKIEKGESPFNTVHPSTLHKIERALIKAGISFTQRGGVEFARELLTVLRGKDGIIEFSNIVYEHIKQHGGEILVGGVNDTLFREILGGWYYEHADRMMKLNNFTCRSLIAQSDPQDISVDYSGYVRVPDGLFNDVPFYVFGETMGIFLLKGDIKVIIINDADLVNGYKKQFNWLWDEYAPKGVKEKK